MKSTYKLLIIIFLFLQIENLQAQSQVFIQSNCQNVTLTENSTFAYMGRNGYFFLLPNGTPVKITWQNNKWVMYGSINSQQTIYYTSNAMTIPNPPDFSTGNWQPYIGNTCTLSGLSGTGTTNINATTTQTNVCTPGTSTGSATITGTGGNAPYTYSWSTTPAQTTATATGLAAGTYTYVVTDVNNTSITKTVTITEPATAIAVTAASQTNVSCNGGSNGAASINTPTGGAGGYTYNWTPGNPSGDGTTSVTGLTAGTWTCTVTDANGCTKTQNFTITQPAALTATQTQINVACKGSATGSATVTVSGGTSGYTYVWKKGATTLSSTTNTAASLAAGNDYTCTITDAKGCTITKNFTITEPATTFTVTQSQNNPTCWMYVNGNVSVSASGGNSPYTYLWSHNGQQYPSAYNNISQIDAEVGSYSCTVIDANGCTIVKNFTVTQPPAFDIGITKVVSTLKANSSGLAYQWSLNGINIIGATSQIYTPIANGTYQCQIWKNGCDYYSNLITISNLATQEASIASKVKIYPNPVKDVLTIDATKLTNATVEIYDLNGRIIQKEKLNTSVNNIHVSQLVKGNYLLKIVSKEGTQTIKLIKE